jgi:hypothetical protein
MHNIFCTVFTLLPPFPDTFSVPLVPTFPLGRTYSALLFSNFVEEKKRKDKKKNMTFSLV